MPLEPFTFQTDDNVDILIHVPCKLRAKLYESELKAIRSHFTGSVGVGRVRNALMNKNLIEDFAKIVDEYVACGVCADLNRCRPKLIQQKPAPFPDLTAVPSPFFKDNTTDDYRPEPILKVSLDQLKNAYNKYFEWAIEGRVTQNGQILNGIDAFYERYPMTRWAVTKLRNNYERNIATACHRIKSDWDSINEKFFNGDRLETLEEIKSTGSDFHKEGKQVLILKFRLTNSKTKKLVYKPSDIEVDYFLVGNTNQIPNQLDEENNLPSLSEKINSYLHETPGLSLPTYKILRKNPGSSLDQQNDGSVPDMTSSYGYIEFLTHDRDDYVAENEPQVQNFYYIWGRLIAMASLFSVADLHTENMITHGLKPYLIDLEDSLKKPMTQVAETELFNHIWGAIVSDKSVSPFSYVAENNKKFQNTADMRLYNKMEKTASYHGDISRSNKILLKKVFSTEEKAPREYVRQMYNGFEEVLNLLMSCKVDFELWLEKIKNCIARFVPRKTAEFIGSLSKFYSDENCSKNVPANNNYNNIVNFDVHFFDRLDEIWPDNGNSNPGWNEFRNVNYALERWNNNIRDYLNMDLPYYVHRLSNADLLNSQGEKVAVQNVQLLNKTYSINRTTYLPEPSINVVRNQIHQLENTRSARIADLIQTMRCTFSLSDQDISRIVSS